MRRIACAAVYGSADEWGLDDRCDNGPVQCSGGIKVSAIDIFIRIIMFWGDEEVEDNATKLLLFRDHNNPPIHHWQ